MSRRGGGSTIAGSDLTNVLEIHAALRDEDDGVMTGKETSMELHLASIQERENGQRAKED